MKYVIYDDRKDINAFWLYTSYYKALENFYSKNNVQKFISIDQLNIGDSVYIIDDHYLPNRLIWMEDNFIQTVNLLNIKVIVITIEKIYNSFFKDSEEFKKVMNKIKNLYHFSSDAQDSIIFKKPVVKQLFSKNFEYIKNNLNQDFNSKKDAIVFIGQLSTIDTQPWYLNRKRILIDLKQNSQYPIIFFNSNSNLLFEDYLKLISDYKFVINPLGIGSFLSMRYAETIFCGSIPIQQYEEKMINKYDEINNAGIFFKNSEDLKRIIVDIEKYTDYYKNNIIKDKFLEDYLLDINFFEV